MGQAGRANTPPQSSQLKKSASNILSTAQQSRWIATLRSSDECRRPSERLGQESAHKGSLRSPIRPRSASPASLPEQPLQVFGQSRLAGPRRRQRIADGDPPDQPGPAGQCRTLRRTGRFSHLESGPAFSRGICSPGRDTCRVRRLAGASWLIAPCQWQVDV